jgi:hypothetical protein
MMRICLYVIKPWFLVNGYQQCSILKSSTPVICHCGHLFFFLGGGALHKNMLCKVFTSHSEGLSKNRLSQNIVVATYKLKHSWTPILALWHTLSNSSNSCDFDSATSTWKAQLYVNVDFSKQTCMKSDDILDWNLEHWMHWDECHYAVFWWKIWIGLEFMALGNPPKTEGLCLWS